MASPPPRSPIPNISKLPLVIESARLKLRPWTVDDLEDIWPAVSDPEFPRHMSWEAHRDRSETREWLEHSAQVITSNEEVKWAIEHDGKAIGSIGFHEITWQVRAFRLDRAELGYWLAPSHQRLRTGSRLSARIDHGTTFRDDDASLRTHHTRRGGACLTC